MDKVRKVGRKGLQGKGSLSAAPFFSTINSHQFDSPRSNISWDLWWPVESPGTMGIMVKGSDIGLSPPG